MNNELFKAFLNTAPSAVLNAKYSWKQLRLVYGKSTEKAGMTWASTRTKSHHSAILTQGLMSGITANEGTLHPLLGFETEAALESHTARECSAFDKEFTLLYILQLACKRGDTH